MGSVGILPDPLFRMQVVLPRRQVDRVGMRGAVFSIPESIHPHCSQIQEDAGRARGRFKQVGWRHVWPRVPDSTHRQPSPS